MIYKVISLIFLFNRYFTIPSVARAHSLFLSSNEKKFNIRFSSRSTYMKWFRWKFLSNIDNKNFYHYHHDHHLHLHLHLASNVNLSSFSHHDSPHFFLSMRVSKFVWIEVCMGVYVCAFSVHIALLCVFLEYGAWHINFVKSHESLVAKRETTRHTSNPISLVKNSSNWNWPQMYSTWTRHIIIHNITTSFISTIRIEWRADWLTQYNNCSSK